MHSYVVSNGQGKLDRIAFFERLEMIAPGYYKNAWVVESFSPVCPRPLTKVVVKSNLNLEQVSMIAGDDLSISLLPCSENWEIFTEALVDSLREQEVVSMSDHGEAA
jgi:hypothetical protein